jgi:hypothetical protein
MRKSIAFYVLGLLVFTTMATFGVNYWDSIYFIWDKAKDSIFLFTIWQFSKKKYHNTMRPVFILSLVRLLWDFVANLTGIYVNNTLAVGILFTLYIIYVSYTIIKNARS